jgi:hypothetical protein
MILTLLHHTDTSQYEAEVVQLSHQYVWLVDNTNTITYTGTPMNR